MNAAIDLRAVGKRFLGRVALSDVTLSVPPGRFVALIGKNGAGKSTLMRMLVRQEALSTGSGFVLGRDLDDDPPDGNSDVGYVSEAIDFAVPLPLDELFAWYARIHPRWDQEMFETILGESGIPLSSHFGGLSRGQRMHVAFAAAISPRPKLLILDEITSVLDANARARFMGIMGRFAADGGTVLLATNMISEVQHHVDHLVLLHDGTVKLNAPLSEIAAPYVKLRRKKGSDHDIFSNPECAEVSLNSDGALSYIVPAPRAAGLPDGLVDRRRITIEEIFIYFTKSRWK